MTDLEIAVSHWLRDTWTPGKRCEWIPPAEAREAGFVMICQCCAVVHPMIIHDIPCPPLTRDLAMRLLEAMLRDETFLQTEWAESLFHIGIGEAGPCYEDVDLPTAIVKAAAALARKE